MYRRGQYKIVIEYSTLDGALVATKIHKEGQDRKGKVNPLGVLKDVLFAGASPKAMSLLEVLEFVRKELDSNEIALTKPPDPEMFKTRYRRGGKYQLERWGTKLYD
jgi:hypothetical protein